MKLAVPVSPSPTLPRRDNQRLGHRFFDGLVEWLVVLSEGANGFIICPRGGAVGTKPAIPTLVFQRHLDRKIK